MCLCLFADLAKLIYKGLITMCVRKFFLRVEIYLLLDPIESDVSGEQATDSAEARFEAPTLIDSDSDDGHLGKYSHTMLYDADTITFNTCNGLMYPNLNVFLNISRKRIN